MANFEHDVSPIRQRAEANASAAWTHDAVALVSAAAFAVAVKFALQFHFGASTNIASVAAGAAYAVLAALHLWTRPRPNRIAPALKSKPRRRSKQVAEASSAEVDADAPPAPATPIAKATRMSTQGARTAAVAVPKPSQVAPDGFEHLQTLVAELARMTPGPKANSPDPDAVQAATAVAWAQYAATRSDQHHSSTRHAAAADGIVSVLAQSEPTPTSKNAPGFAAKLADALAANRLTVYLEPIQQIETDRPRHYEVSVRFNDATGTEMPHALVLAAARDAGMLPRVDAALLPRAARIAQHFQLRGRDTEIFSRVHAASLPDLDFRDEVTAATIAADGAALVLSFEQNDVRAFGPVHWQILSTISDMGLRFAIESVTDLDMDFEALKYRGFNFVKLDADVLIEGLPATGAMVASADVCRHLASVGLALIVSHIDDEQALARILGFGVLFGQGSLFGTKRAVRSDILTSAVAA